MRRWIALLLAVVLVALLPAQALADGGEATGLDVQVLGKVAKGTRFHARAEVATVAPDGTAPACSGTVTPLGNGRFQVTGETLAGTITASTLETLPPGTAVYSVHDSVIQFWPSLKGIVIAGALGAGILGDDSPDIGLAVPGGVIGITGRLEGSFVLTPPGGDPVVGEIEGNILGLLDPDTGQVRVFDRGKWQLPEGNPFGARRGTWRGTLRGFYNPDDACFVLWGTVDLQGIAKVGDEG